MTALVSVWLAWLAGNAGAGPPRYPVVITSEPDGATVWINDRSAEPVGKTPYTVRLQPGSHTIFIELDGHRFTADTIRVRKLKRKQRFSYELEELKVGYINVLPEQGSADGAVVTLDGKKMGTVPDTFEAVEGSHELRVSKKGFETFETLVEVARGESLDVSVSLKPLVAKKPAPAAAVVRAPEVTRASPSSTRRRPILAAEAGLGTGWRTFDYDEPRTSNLRPYQADGVMFAELDLMLFLGALGSAAWLDKLLVFADFSLSLPLESSTQGGNEAIQTTWFRRDIGIRFVQRLGPSSLIIEAAEGGNSFSFANAGSLAAEIPEVAYEYIRLGAAVRLAIGNSSIGAGGDGMAVLDAGDLASRFAAAEVFGVRGHGFVHHQLGKHLGVTLAGSVTRFVYTFEPSLEYDADGSTDRMIDVVLAGGYRF